MKKLRFGDLYSQEYYFEKVGFDCRIAVKKLNDARDTMGMAKLSLSYINPEQTDDWEKNFVKTLPSFVGVEGKPNIKHNPTAINMNEYFKEA